MHPWEEGACDRHCLSLCQCNGMSNRFWGWGREDDEFYRRIKGAGLQVRLLEWLCLVLAYLAVVRFPLLLHPNSWIPLVLIPAFTPTLGPHLTSPVLSAGASSPTGWLLRASAYVSQ